MEGNTPRMFLGIRRITYLRSELLPLVDSQARPGEALGSLHFLKKIHFEFRERMKNSLSG